MANPGLYWEPLGTVTHFSFCFFCIFYLFSCIYYFLRQCNFYSVFPHFFKFCAASIFLSSVSFSIISVFSVLYFFYFSVYILFYVSIFSIFLCAIFSLMFWFASIFSSSVIFFWSFSILIHSCPFSPYITCAIFYILPFDKYYVPFIFCPFNIFPFNIIFLMFSPLIMFPFNSLCIWNISLYHSLPLKLSNSLSPCYCPFNILPFSFSTCFSPFSRLSPFSILSL